MINLKTEDYEAIINVIFIVISSIIKNVSKNTTKKDNNLADNPPSS